MLFTANNFEVQCDDINRVVLFSCYGAVDFPHLRIAGGNRRGVLYAVAANAVR